VLFKEFISTREVFDYLNLDLDNLDLFAEWERKFSKHAFGKIILPRHEIISKENLDSVERMDEYLKYNYILEDANRNKTQQLKRDIVINQRNIIKQKNEEIEKKNKQIKRKNRTIRKKNYKIKEYSGSNSWRITEPFRRLRRFFRNR
jgi:hypothetical protein